MRDIVLIAMGLLGLFMPLTRHIFWHIVWVVCVFSVGYVVENTMESSGSVVNQFIGSPNLQNIRLAIMCLGVGMVISLVWRLLRRH